ncbi:MAG: lysophospholipid acyltransferase family protein [Bacteroidota bacterium]|nr:lysophospholipid acyltransferase family protein [Bacteroidota bacterium]
MKKRLFLFPFYQWIVVFPILLILTILVALATILLSPVFPNTRLSYFPARLWARVACKFCFVHVKVVGLENLNPHQSYVLALNHQSLFDIFVVYGWMPCFFKWMIKAEVHRIPFVGQACDAAGHIFINRSNPVSARLSLEKAKARLQNGVSLAIFPEGTRTYSGQMGKFKRGAFRIATDLSLPIVPISLKGGFDRLPRNTLNVTPGLIEMIIHKPIDLNFEHPENGSDLIQQTWDIIHSSL